MSAVILEKSIPQQKRKYLARIRRAEQRGDFTKSHALIGGYCRLFLWSR